MEFKMNWAGFLNLRRDFEVNTVVEHMNNNLLQKPYGSYVECVPKQILLYVNSNIKLKYENSF